MRTVVHASIWLGLISLPLYLSIVQINNTLAKYDYCDDAVMADKYYLPKPDFTEYGLGSKPKCTQ